MTVRFSTPEDVPQLKQLWSIVFEDKDSYLDRFFGLLPELGVCFLAEQDSAVISAAYLLKGISLPDGRSACYLYAVATLPEARGRGASSSVMRVVRSYADSEGLVLLTLPAEDWLYDYYGKTLGAVHCSHFVQDLFLPLPDSRIRCVSDEEYRIAREASLCGIPHCGMTPVWYSLLEGLCNCYDGGLFLFGDSGCAGYPNEDGVFCVSDCFGPGGSLACRAAAAQRECSSGQRKIPSPEGDLYMISDDFTDFDEIMWIFTFE